MTAGPLSTKMFRLASNVVDLFEGINIGPKIGNDPYCSISNYVEKYMFDTSMGELIWNTIR